MKAKNSMSSPHAQMAVRCSALLSFIFVEAKSNSCKQQQWTDSHKLVKIAQAVRTRAQEFVYAGNCKCEPKQGKQQSQNQPELVARYLHTLNDQRERREAASTEVQIARKRHGCLPFARRFG